MEAIQNEHIQSVCNGVLNASIRQIGDYYGMEEECPFCLSMCRWDDSTVDVAHDDDCIYKIEKAAFLESSSQKSNSIY